MAVIVAEWIRLRSEHRARRMHAFKTLMATRTINLAPLHIDAINFIELEFHKDQKVMDQWRLYRMHLDVDSKTPTPEAWENERKKRLNELLFELSVAVGLSHDRSAIEKGAYYPQGMNTVDLLNAEIRQALHDILTGKKQLPMKAEVYTSQQPKTEEKKDQKSSTGGTFGPERTD